MADSRDVQVWTNHSVEQWNENKVGHTFNDDYILRKSLLELPGVVKCLDLGCGGSLWRKLFVGREYTGADQNESMIEYARKRFPEDSFFVCPAEATPFDDASFDLVFTSAVLQHNRHERKEAVVKEIVRILRPGGYYMCTENTFRTDNFHHTFPGATAWNEHMDDGYSFTAKGWERFFRAHGLSLVWFSEPSEYLYIKAV